MRKLTARFSIAAIVAILAIAYAGASWFVGRQAEALIHDRVAALNQEIQQYVPPDGPRITLSIEDYQRHFFTSDVRYALTIAAGGDTRQIRFAGRLVHGPLPFTELRRGNLQPLMAASYLRLLPSNSTAALFAARTDDSRAPVWVRTTLTFRGSGESNWHFQPLQSAQVTFSGGTATLTLANNFRDARLDAAFGGLKIDNDDLFVHARDIGIHGVTKAGDGGATTSKVVASVGLLTTRAGAGPQQKSTDSRLVVNVTRAHGLLDASVQYSVGHMQAGARDMGQFAFAAHASDVDGWALRVLQQIAAGRRPRQPYLSMAVNALLAAEPVIAIDTLQWQMPAGTSAATLSLHLTQPEAAASQPLLVTLPEAVERGELTAALSKPMLVAVLEQSLVDNGSGAAGGRRAEAMVQEISSALTQSGLFVENGTLLRTNVSYRDRTFVVNGEKMSLGAVVFRIVGLVAAIK